VARPQQLLGGRGVERAQAEPLGRRLPHQERDERGERMPPVDILIPVGGNEEERQRVDPVRDEAQQVEARAVRPMEVFQHEYERSLRGQGNEEVARLREEARLARRAVEAGDGRSVDGIREDLDATGDLDPRAVGWGLGAVIAVAGEDVRPRLRRRAAERIRKGGLADARLAADQDHAAPAMTRHGQPVVEEGEFAVPTDRGWAQQRRWRDSVHALPTKLGVAATMVR
jgi:hypothetical protein